MAKKKKAKDEKGITAEKDELSEWYPQLLQKAELIEYSPVSGCYILRPRLYVIWEKVQEYFNKKIKKDGIQNSYFPLLIPESLLSKEQEHVKGFNPEVAWVTQTGDNKLAEKLALRPTSETIIYPAYSKWIRSWRDLPLRLNQWCNIVRWEFKYPIPLIRSREFLWQEGHSAFATKQEAEKDAEKILNFYEDVFREMYAIPVIKGTKTQKEKFAGAEKTLTVEIFLPSGKSAQGATSHHLGQNFSKTFNIKFKDKDEKEKFVWQTSWGISTRSIGICIMMHSDNHGLVLPPAICETKVAIVPIFKNETEKKSVLMKAEEIKRKLSVGVELDMRDYSPGYKFNDWEMKGIPLRIEIGPRDIKNNSVVIVRRDNNKKQNIKVRDLNKKILNELKDMQDSLLKKAEKFLKDSIINVKNMKELIKAIKNKKLVHTEWCGSTKCENWIKDKTGGAKIMFVDKNAKAKIRKCVYCNKKAESIVYIAKSY